MTPTLILTVNVATGQLLALFGGRQELDLRAGIYATCIYLRDNDTSANSGRTKAFDPSGYDGIRVGIWPTSAGADGAELCLTDQTQWTYNTDDAENPYFAGTLNLTTPAILQFLGNELFAGAYFCIKLVSGADLIDVFDQTGEPNITLRACTDPGSGNGVDNTGRVPIIKGPFQVQFPSGKVYLFDEPTGNPPTVQITCINP